MAAADQPDLPFDAPAPSPPTAAIVPFPCRRMVGRIRRQGRMLRDWNDDAVVGHLDRLFERTFDRLVLLGVDPATAQREAHAFCVAVAAERDGPPPDRMEG